MTACRMAALILLLGITAGVLVYLRAEQVRSAASAIALECQSIEARRELWRIQVAVARLRAPAHVHDWMTRFQNETLPPEVISHEGTRVVVEHLGG